MDAKRVIAEDLMQSQEESRYYCFALNQDKTGILTVRFIYHSGCIRNFRCRLLAKRQKNL